MPCQAIRMVANAMNSRVAEAEELRLVGRQQARDRLLNRRNEIERWLRRHGVLLGRATAAARCGGRRRRPPRTPRSPRCRSRHVTSCMFIAAASVSRARLLSTSSCSTTPLSSCARACRCRAPMSAAPLILSSTAVVLCSSDAVGDVPLERLDRRQFLCDRCSAAGPCRVSPAMAAASATSRVASCASAARRAAGVQAPEQRSPASSTGWLDPRKAPPDASP